MSDCGADAKHVQPRRTLRPRDAATLIVVDSSSGEPRVLLGRRRPTWCSCRAATCFPAAASIRQTGTIAVEHDLAAGQPRRS